MKDKVIILGSFRFPDKDAAAGRVLGYGKVIRDHGCEVLYLDWGDEKSTRYKKFQNFYYKSMNEFNNGEGNILYKVYRYLTIGSNTIKELNNMDLSQVKYIIAYHGTSIFLLRLKRLCKKNNITLIVDCTEWYDSSHLPGGKFGLPSIDNAIRMRFINPIIGKIIVISNYLLEYYEKKADTVVKVNNLLDFSDNIKFNNLKLDKPIRLVYIGSPGKKDKFDLLLKVLNALNKDEIFFTLDIFGINKEEFTKSFPVLQNYVNNDFTVFHGKIKKEQLEKVVSSFHFSVIIRPNERYAQAGFPTKLSESMMHSVPVIATKVGDIPEYLKSRSNGFLIDELSFDVLSDKLKEILSLTDQDYVKLRLNAFKTAKRYFNYKTETNIFRILSKEEK